MQRYDTASRINSRCAILLNRFCSSGSSSGTCREYHSIHKKNGKEKQIHSRSFRPYTICVQPRNCPAPGTRQLYRVGYNINKNMRRTCKIRFYIVCHIKDCLAVTDHTDSPQPFETTQIRVQRTSYTVSRVYADKNAFIASVDEVDRSVTFMALANPLVMKDGQFETFQLPFLAVKRIQVSAPSAFMATVTVSVSSSPLLGHSPIIRDKTDDMSIAFDLRKEKVRDFAAVLRKRGLVRHCYVVHVRFIQLLSFRNVSWFPFTKSSPRLKRMLSSPSKQGTISIHLL